MQNRIKDIKEALELILNKMEREGLLRADCDKEKLRDQVLEHLEQNNIELEPKDLNEEPTKKLLVGVVISQMLGVKDDDYTKEMKAGNTMELKDSLEKKLAASVALMAALKDLKPDQLNNILKPALAKVKEHPAPSPEQKRQHETEVGLLERQLTDTYRSLNGGDDPRVTGEITGPVGQILGNLMGFTNPASADPKATSFMVEAITFNAGKPDPNGTENLAKLSELMSGVHASHKLTRE